MGECYFSDEGLEVIPQSVNGSAAIRQALASGQAQFGRPGPAPVIQANARGEEVVFLYNSLPRSSSGILVQAEYEYQEPDDHKGNPTGVCTADGAEVGFVQTLSPDSAKSEQATSPFTPVRDGGHDHAGRRYA